MKPTSESWRGLLNELEAAWCRETSADPTHWDPWNPAWGQCAVTALVVQDRFGGDLLRATVAGTSHYWNRLPDGTEVDLTRHQFDVLETDPIGVVREREYVLSFPDTKRRYEMLLLRLGA